MLNTCLPWLIPVENGEYLLIISLSTDAQRFAQLTQLQYQTGQMKLSESCR